MTAYNKDAEFIEKAISSKNLTERSDSNQRYASGDFIAWLNSLIDNIRFSSVLDVCCGTGKQLVLYNSKPQVSLIAGVDISKQAIETAMKKLRGMGSGKHLILKAVKMENMFEAPELKDIKFDLIACFYGLYYSANVNDTILKMVEHMSSDGTILVVGPYGKNNSSLFDLLSRYFKLPELVIRSSTTFMKEEIFPLLSKKCEIKQAIFVNKIHYPTAEALINYWKASTFYFPEFEDKVCKEINEYFSNRKEFVVEKHVMAIIAKRKT